MLDRILRRVEVSAATGFARSTLYQRIAQGLFPQPFHLGQRMSGWRESEISAINNAHVRGASDGEIRALVSELVARRQEVA
jgi:prophage regulatory protein